MLKNFRVLAAILCVATTAGFTSCDDDDDNNPGTENIGPENVFPAGLPSQVDNMKITTNAEGKVTKIDNGYNVTEFKYGTFSRATTYQVIMTQYDTEHPDDKRTIYLQLNSDGFVSHALEVYADGDEDTWDFAYNQDGQLNYMKRSEGGNEVTNVTYTNGDITKVSVRDDENNSSISNITYTSDSIKSPIDNKGAIMLFDETFGIDMDEMAEAYYAGLLGKATKHLPVKLEENNGSSTFDWKLNASQLPVEFISTTVSEWGDYSETIIFKW